MLLNSVPKVIVSWQPVLTWAYKMDTVKDGEADSWGPSRTDRSDHDRHVCSLLRGTRKTPILRAVRLVPAKTLTLGVQEGKKISMFLIQNMLKNLAAQLDWVSRSQAQHPQSDKSLLVLQKGDSDYIQLCQAENFTFTLHSITGIQVLTE